MKKRLVLAICFSVFLICPFFAEKWYVCLSSFRVIENAAKFQSELNEKNIDNVIVEYKLDNGTLYRVFIDKAFDSRDVARNYINTVQKLPAAKSFNFTGLWVCAKSDSNKIVTVKMPEPKTVAKPAPAPVVEPVITEIEDFEEPEEEERLFEFDTIIEDEGPDYYWLTSEDDFFDAWIAGTWNVHYVYRCENAEDNEDETDTVVISGGNKDSNVSGWFDGTLSSFVFSLFVDVEFLKNAEGYTSGDPCFYLTEDENTFSIKIESNDNPDEYYCLYEFTRK